LKNQINRLHHQDESRHLAYGRALIKQMFIDFNDIWSDAAAARIQDNTIKFMQMLLASLWNPKVYSDAGVK